LASGFSHETDKIYKSSSELIMESVVNIRTVYTLNCEEIIKREYSEKLLIPQKKAAKTAIFTGFAFGSS
jgi:hypothetical protein